MKIHFLSIFPLNILNFHCADRQKMNGFFKNLAWAGGRGQLVRRVLAQHPQSPELQPKNAECTELGIVVLISNPGTLEAGGLRSSKSSSAKD